MLHKTDGSHTNRPFFRTIGSDVRETSFSPKENLPRSVFCFFSSRKENVPLLFFLEEKTVSLHGKRNPSDGRTQAHPALSSVGIPQRVCLPPPPCLCPCPPRLRASFPVQTDHAKESHLRNSCSSLLLSFSRTCYTKRTVHMETVRFSVQLGRTCGKALFLRKTPLPRSVFCFFSSRKENVPLSRKENVPLSRKENVPPLIRRKENVPPSFSIYANKQSKTHGHMQTVRFGRCCVLSEKAEKSECVPRAAGSPPPTVGGPRRMQRRVQRSSASCTGRSPYRACPV